MLERKDLAPAYATPAHGPFPLLEDPLNLILALTVIAEAIRTTGERRS